MKSENLWKVGALGAGEVAHVSAQPHAAIQGHYKQIISSNCLFLQETPQSNFLFLQVLQGPASAPIPPPPQDSHHLIR